MIGLVVLSTAAAYILYFRILASSGAVNFLLVSLFLPITAVLLGYAFLDETLEQRHYGGMILIAFGLAEVYGRPLKFLRRAL